MTTIELAATADFAGFLEQARPLIERDVPPEQVTVIAGEQADLFSGGVGVGPGQRAQRRRQAVVPVRFERIGRVVARHSAEERYPLLYCLLWRLQQERMLLDNPADADMRRAERMHRAVRRDAHKMKAFVRFRRVEEAGRESYVAWFEPEHHIVDAVAPFFARRFTGMRWSVLTPRMSAHWDGSELRYSPGIDRRSAPTEDALEALWRTYYASIFNPARLKTAAMQSEMPRKYWRNLPEAQDIAALVRRARKPPAVSLDPPHAAEDRAPYLAGSRADRLAALNAGIEACRRCPIGACATRSVPGSGPPAARLVIVGEQPGDSEDRSGRPFVGPAGRLLDELLREAAVDRAAAYLTNAVKHFKFVTRGRQRLHKRPTFREVEQCRWWLNLELDIVDADICVALGATAARALTGSTVSLEEVRGKLVRTANGKRLLISHHPAAILRAPADERPRLRRELLGDLELAGQSLES